MNELSIENLETALITLGKSLISRDLYYELVVIGGGGLLLIGLTTRATKDLDIVALINKGELISAKPLPKHLIEAIEAVAMRYNLRKDWINTGPSDLLTLGLPSGFKNRLSTIHYDGLTIHLAGRFDQVCFKLYATVDQGPKSKHYIDLKHLKPSEAELEEAKHWCITHDISEAFLHEIEIVIKEINENHS